MYPQQTLLISLDTDALSALMRDVVRTELSAYIPPAPKQALPEYLTRIETANLYRISLVTLNEWEKNGLMPKKITVNGRVRFRRDEILATLETVKQVKHKKRAA